MMPKSVPLSSTALHDGAQYLQTNQTKVHINWDVRPAATGWTTGVTDKEAFGAFGRYSAPQNYRERRKDTPLQSIVDEFIF